MLIDLDAVLGEVEDKTLRFKGTEFVLPGELPGACLTPFLAPEVGLPKIIADLIAADESTGEDDDAGWFGNLIDTLVKRPDLPFQLVQAAGAALSELLEYVEGQTETFHGLKPSVNAYAAVAVHLAKSYGLDLTDFFSSDESSEAGGETSSQTSSGSTDSTPEGSGDAPEPTAS